MVSTDTIPLKAIKHLTQFLSEGGARSYLRMGDGELKYLLHKKLYKTGLSIKHYDRLVTAYQNCGYVDLVLHNKYNRSYIGKLDFDFHNNVYVNDLQLDYNFHNDWNYFEFKDFINNRRCLFVGAEALLLKELYNNPEYRILSNEFWPKDSYVVFYQPIDSGNNLDKNLDAIKNNIAETISRDNIDTCFISLGGCAKILCYELAEELNITTIDWGSIIRALCYSATRGDLHEEDYSAFFFRVPFYIFMKSLESAHPELDSITILKKAHAQLKLEMKRKFKRNGKIKVVPSPENKFHFSENLNSYYNWLHGRITMKCLPVLLNFELWQFKNDLSPLGHIPKPIISFLAFAYHITRSIKFHTFYILKKKG